MEAWPFGGYAHKGCASLWLVEPLSSWSKGAQYKLRELQALLPDADRKVCSFILIYKKNCHIYSLLVCVSLAKNNLMI